MPSSPEIAQLLLDYGKDPTLVIIVLYVANSWVKDARDHACRLGEAVVKIANEGVTLNVRICEDAPAAADEVVPITHFKIVE